MVAQYELRELQFGLETTPGTLVASDTGLRADWTYTPGILRQEDDAPRGIRATILDDFHDIQKTSALSVSHALDMEQIGLWLSMGVAEPATSGVGDPYTHVFTPALTGVAVVDTATIEMRIRGGSTVYERRFGYAMCSGLTIDIPNADYAGVTAEIFGRSEQALDGAWATRARTAYTLVPSPLFGIWIDGTWANLGTTAKLGLLRSATLNLTNGIDPGFTLDARADLDMTVVHPAKFEGTLELELENTAAATTEIDAWRAGTRRAIRLKAASGTKSIQFDMIGEYIEGPNIGENDGSVETQNLTLQIGYDTTGTKAFEATLINALAAY